MMKSKPFTVTAVLFIGWLAAAVCGGAADAVAAQRMSLAGPWRFRLDPNSVGEIERWFNTDLPDRITLPGTTDQQGKGYALDKKTMTYPSSHLKSGFQYSRSAKRMDQVGYLVRDFLYIGKAWYQRTFEVPDTWSGKHLQLRLERVNWQSKVWLDGKLIGAYDSLVTEHRYDLGVQPPGRHRLTICVNNNLVHDIGIISHAYGPETQSRWNGIVGRIDLTATAPLFIKGLKVYPATDRKSVRVAVRIDNTTSRSVRGSLRLAVQDEKDDTVVGVIESPVTVERGEQVIGQVVRVTQSVQPWDEFNTKRYRLVAELTSGAHHDRSAAWFGFRDIARSGRHILVNGRRVFLRGTLDCCVYPKTGHPPLTVDAWLNVLGTIKQYGFNHVRYHSWCPPDAAFEAADRLGLYLQPESPFWDNDFGTKPDVVDYVRNEVRRISDAYGNHPSFAMFCVGNEFNGKVDWNLLNHIISDAKQRDPRRLYLGSTARRRGAADDYWVTHNSGKATRGVGPARTNWDFTAAAHATDLPLIAHETGQRPVYPDYADLLPKFTGPLKPYNLERFMKMAIASGVADQVKDFERASAWHQLTQYKAEHEAMLRTADYAGYQLLMLNDFTGQSEALVGVLDPFWETKGVVGVEDVRQWNAPTVLLARFNTYTWTTQQTFEAEVDVSHFGQTDLHKATVQWSLTTAAGDVIEKGALQPIDIPAGKLTRIGTITIALAKVPAPAIAYFRLRMGRTTNVWKLGVYRPAIQPVRPPKDILITKRFDDATLAELQRGGKVLYLSYKLKNKNARRHGFYSQYWSAGWWGNKFSLLGVMCNPKHPALAAFPTAGHSDWFWFDPLNGGVSIDLTDVMPRGYKPIIQGVTDFHFNRLLGQLFELRVGRGRLMVCGYNLSSNLANRHAARQLRRSIVQYMDSERFAPKYSLDRQQALDLLGTPLLTRLGAMASADSQAKGYEAAKAIDGNPNTIWHTPWTGDAPRHPHHVIIDLKKKTKLAGITYLPRQDQANGRVARYAVYVSSDGKRWGKSVATGVWRNDTERKTVRFAKPVVARYIKFVSLSEVSGQRFASVAELDVITAATGH